MSEIPLRDLLTAVGFTAVAFTLFNMLVSFGSGKPLADWINPHRRYLPSLAVVLLVGGYALLVRAGYRHRADIGELLIHMIKHDQAHPEVIGAVSFGLLAAVLVALYFWCRWLFPRAPATFTPGAADLTAEYRRAMRHYVRWSGQLDYVVLWRRNGGEPRKLAWYHLPAGKLVPRMRRVESLHVAENANAGEVARQQLIRWDELALRLFQNWENLDGLLLPAGHGANSLLFFDLQFGGVFIELLPGFQGASGEVQTYLFAVCVNQAELNAATATRYYAMLSAAIRHIRSGGQKT